MLFNSLVFLVFLPLFLALYFATRGRTRLLVCLIGSYVFYGWWDYRFLSLIAISTGLDYFIGLALVRVRRPSKRRALLTMSVAGNLSLLGVFKYFDFFAESFEGLMNALGVSVSAPVLGVVLPVGISFYTFQTLSYSIDVFRGELEPERSLLRFATFVAFWPQLVAGPIVRASVLLPQLRALRRIEWDRVVSGVNLVLWGYVLKVVVADSLAPFADTRFAHPAAHGSFSLLLGVLFYAFQIYGDFCGYSSIAIGLGRILGFEFGRNFNRPYFSRSFSEFWSRWHISLSSWLRDYLYIPLGGNRRGAKRTFVNLVITMFLGGLWHGSNWTFVVWGLLHGAYLVMQRMISRPWRSVTARLRIPQLVSGGTSMLVVFLLTCLGWVFFRSQTFGDAFTILGRIAAWNGGWSLRQVPQTFLAVKGLGLIAGLVVAETVQTRCDLERLSRRYPVLTVLYMVGCLWALALLGTYQGQSFIYFQF